MGCHRLWIQILAATIWTLSKTIDLLDLRGCHIMFALQKKNANAEHVFNKNKYKKKSNWDLEILMT